MFARLTKATEVFIRKARKKYKKRYDYSNTEYRGKDEKVIITCPEHGDFKQTPTSHLRGHRGCRICAIERTTRSVVVRFKKIWGNKYDYSRFQYLGAVSRALFICPMHGEFRQTPYGHWKGLAGCEGCFEDQQREKAAARFLKRFGPFRTISGGAIVRYTGVVVRNKRMSTWLPVYKCEWGHEVYTTNGSNSGVLPRSCPGCVKAEGSRWSSIATVANAHGISVTEYRRRKDRQRDGDGVLRCVICHKPENGITLQIDHDHGCCDDKGKSCGKCDRDFVCGTCNGLISRIEHRVELGPLYHKIENRIRLYVLHWKRQHRRGVRVAFK